jgi:hypothetical protein
MDPVSLGCADGANERGVALPRMVALRKSLPRWRKRLALLIGDDATIDTIIDPDLDGGWVRIAIRLPTTTSQPPAVSMAARALESL